jgi:copper chaperone CopZ
MSRNFLFLSTLFFSTYSVDAWACPMADAAVYKTDAEAVQKAEGKKASFKLEGMTCGSCSDKVKASISELDGVILAAVDYQTGAVEIAFDEKKTSLKKLEEKLIGTGYKLVEKPS